MQVVSFSSYLKCHDNYSIKKHPISLKLCMEKDSNKKKTECKNFILSLRCMLLLLLKWCKIQFLSLFVVSHVLFMFTLDLIYILFLNLRSFSFIVEVGFAYGVISNKSDPVIKKVAILDGVGKTYGSHSETSYQTRGGNLQIS